MTNYQLQIKRFVFGPFQTNCYVITNNQSPITNNQSPMVLLVDPACSNGYERGQLEQYIENQKSKIKNQKSKIENQKSPITIVATHGHLDHLWGAAWACAKWNTPVLMHEADIPMAKAMQQQYDLFGIRAKAQPFPIEDIKSKIKNQKFEIINHKFEITNPQLPMTNVSIISTPGHTPGSICLYFQKSKITNHQSPGASSRRNGKSGLRLEGLSPITNPFILSGDTLFHMGYGRTDLPGGNYSQLMNSLDLLLALPPETVVYPGHGEPTTIGAETGYYQSPIPNYQ